MPTSLPTVDSCRTFGGIPVVPVVNRIAAPLAWRQIRPDIIHETYFALSPVGNARRRVVTIHDMINELFAEQFSFAKRVTAAKRAAVNRADHVICVSENTRRDLVRLFGVDPARTSVIHLGYSITAEADINISDFGRRRPILLYVGDRSVKYKNFAALLQAYSRSHILRGFDLVAFGGGPFRPNELKQIMQLGINDRVRVECGSDQELAEHYRTATAFVYPSMYEGFGLPPLEAMSHGCPVVCSNGGSIPEIVGEAAVYFDPNNLEELRVTMERVATTEALQADLRSRGYDRIAAFSWDKCAAATAQVYRELM